jgi:hypothetical protein
MHLMGLPHDFEVKSLQFKRKKTQRSILQSGTQNHFHAPPMVIFPVICKCNYLLFTQPFFTLTFITCELTYFTFTFHVDFHLYSSFLFLSYLFFPYVFPRIIICPYGSISFSFMFWLFYIVDWRYLNVDIRAFNIDDRRFFNIWFSGCSGLMTRVGAGRTGQGQETEVIG